MPYADPEWGRVRRALKNKWKEYKRNRILQGRCVDCDGKLASKTLCEKCLEKFKERYKKRKSLVGICHVCTKVKVTKFKLCLKCRIREREGQKRRKDVRRYESSKRAA